MKIEWSIDDENGLGVDLDDLLGSIYISHNDSIIEDNITYLDSWFNSLIDGHQAMQEGRTEFISDLIDEPDPLCFVRVCDEITIAYRDVTLPPCSLEEFSTALLDTLISLLKAIENSKPSRSRTTIYKIKMYINNAMNSTHRRNYT